MLKKNFDRPPMGWNSYDYYDTTVNEEQIKANAEYMAKHLKDAGYEYVVVDIQWYASEAGSRRNEHQYIPFEKLNMDGYGRLVPCEKRFPSSKDGKGFKPLADYVHSLGLKFGIHIMRGIPRDAVHSHTSVLYGNTTANEIADPSSISKWNPDMYGVKEGDLGQAYYDSLIELYATWGVDFIKCDDICNTNMYTDNPYSARHEVEMLSKAMDKVNREMVLSLSPGPALIEEAWHYEKYAHMWRITDDFWDNWDLLKDMFSRTKLWERHVFNGSYPDCDMLPIGLLGKGFDDERLTRFTKAEQRTMMTLWSMFRSPLMVGANLTQLDDWTLKLLTNRELIKFLSEGYTGKLIEMNEKYVVWHSGNVKEQCGGVGIFNLSDEAIDVSLDSEWLRKAVYNDNIIDLWTGSQYGLNDEHIEVTVNAHDVVFLISR